MLVVFECTTVFQRMRHLNELRSLQTPKQSIQVQPVLATEAKLEEQCGLQWNVQKLG